MNQLVTNRSEQFFIVPREVLLEKTALQRESYQSEEDFHIATSYNVE